MKHVRKVFLRNGSSWIDFALSGEPVRGQARSLWMPDG